MLYLQVCIVSDFTVFGALWMLVVTLCAVSWHAGGSAVLYHCFKWHKDYCVGIVSGNCYNLLLQSSQRYIIKDSLLLKVQICKSLSSSDLTTYYFNFYLFKRLLFLSVLDRCDS